MKKRKGELKKELKKKKITLQNKIIEHTDNFNLPIINDDNKNIVDTHSGFSIVEHIQDHELFDKNIEFENDELEMDNFFTKKFQLFPTPTQQIIIQKWLNCYIKMYNETIKYIKKCKFNGQKVIFSITKLKVILATQKNEIRVSSKIIIDNKEIYVDKHLLDYAINDAIKRYESCITNLLAGNIRYFRLRYLKHNKETKIFKIEKGALTEKGMYVRSFGKQMLTSITNFNFVNNWHTMMTLQYIQKTNSYMLLVKYPTDMKNEIHENTECAAIIDPGVRKMNSIYSNEKVVLIGENLDKQIKQRLIRIDKINASDLTAHQKSNITEKKYNKIKNLITDVHWKIIKYLTTNFDTILIGNWSTKKSGENGKVSKMTKRIAQMYRIFDFKQKLKYKCHQLGIQYKEVDEAYTSKCCCKCGNYKKDLGGNEVYKCKKCHDERDRDINGSICIAIKGKI